MDFLWFLLIGAAAGWLAGQIMKSSGFGMLGNIIVGVLGAMLGGWLFGLLGISVADKLIGSLITALVGAVVLLAVVGFVGKKKKK
ncbi:MAG TPA: GlsB/YeaQ/YmgE family stress response membrane protein [Sedimentisphaerales bacterium]|nr:GlsB/YeaQ/YmgE family stress response membrane protein [Sedimentisphaerales bacterium]